MPTMFRLVAEIDASGIRALRAKIPEAEAIAADRTQDGIVAHAQRDVPVRTGFLWSTVRGRAAGGHWLAEATAPYAGFVEFGTRFMAAQPYMYPAFAWYPYHETARQALAEIGFSDG